MMKKINYLIWNVFVTNEALFDKCLMNIYAKEANDYQAITFGIRSIFVFIQFKLDRIVQDRPNIAVTYNEYN